MTTAAILALKAQHPDWSYGRVAGVLGVSRGAVAGALYRQKHGSGKTPRGRLRGRKSPVSKLTEEQVRTIRASWDRTVRDLAAEHGVAVGTVSAIRSGETWKHVA